jgi:hypothetical protein
LTISNTPSGQSGFPGAGQSASSSGYTSAPSHAQSSADSFSSETKQAIEQSEALGKNTIFKTGLQKLLSDSLLSPNMRRRGHFTADFLEKTAFLWFGKDEKGLLYPGNAVIMNRENRGVFNRYEQKTYQQFDNIAIQPFPASAASYHVGDTVDIVHSYRFVKFGGRTANLVRRTGRARITGAKGQTLTALLFKTWDVVQSDDRVDTLARCSDLITDTIIDPTVTVRGTFFCRVEQTEQLYLYHTIIIDRGSKDGVGLGDIFAIISCRGPAAGRTQAIACAVNIGETSSTLLIERLFDNNAAAGDTVVLVKRILFKK